MTKLTDAELEYVERQQVFMDITDLDISRAMVQEIRQLRAEVSNLKTQRDEWKEAARLDLIEINRFRAEVADYKEVLHLESCHCEPHNEFRCNRCEVLAKYAKIEEKQ